MKIAIVHDWLYIYGGAERVLKAIIQCFPNDDITVHTLFDILSDEDKKTIGYTESKTSFIQKLPQIHKRHRTYLPLMPLAIEQFDLTGYDLIISSSYAVAKGILTGPDQLHISYIHSPMRYAWDLQHQYLRESNKEKGLKSLIARSILFGMRLWDARTAHGPNAIVANSNFVARRIKKIYGRDSTVIFPPVNVSDTLPTIVEKDKRMAFFTASRLVPYKNMHLIVEAFADLPNERLIVAGNGPELARLKSIAGANVYFIGFCSNERLKNEMTQAKAFIFAAEEDFGITPIEAQAQGTPVIAYGKGGVKETIITTGSHPTGLFFNDLSAGAITNAVNIFLTTQERYDPHACHANALRFSGKHFTTKFTKFVENTVQEFETTLASTYAKHIEEENF